MSKELDEALRRAIKEAEGEAYTHGCGGESGRCVASVYGIDDAVRAALASLAADGWVLVPREATAAMNVAGGEAQTQSIGSWGHPNVAWRAMLAAAPKPGGKP